MSFARRRAAINRRPGGVASGDFHDHFNNPSRLYIYKRPTMQIQ
jgi:hypothetical protein